MLDLTITDHETLDEMFRSRDQRAWDDFEDVWIAGPFNHVISIVDSEEPDGSKTAPPGGWSRWEELQAHKLRLEFDDVERDVHALARWAPRRHHIQAIVDFAREGLTEGRVVIHCAAGISRSTAAGLISLVAVGMEPVAAVAYLQTVKRGMRPNRSMVYIADDLLGLKGALVNAYDAVWKRAHDTDRWPGEQA